MSKMLKIRQASIRFYSSLVNKEYLVEKFAPLNDRNHYEYLVSQNANIGKLSKASVLVPICIDPKTSKTQFVFMQRALDMRNYGGQICFMGGKSDPTDRDEIDTALRETYEESGIDASRLTILAKMCPIFTTNIGRDSYLLTPVVAYYDQRDVKLNLNKNEVQELFNIDTEHFLLNDNYEVNSTHLNDQEFYFHYFHNLVPQKDIHIWGITSILAILISAHLHGRLPQFELDPDVKLDLVNVNDYLYKFVINKSKRLINTLVNKQKL